MAQSVRTLPEMQEIWVQSLGWGDPLEKEWQPIPVFLPGRSHGLRSLAGYIQSMGLQELDMTERLHHITGRTDAEPEAPVLWPPDTRVDSLEETLMLGNIEHRRRRG